MARVRPRGRIDCVGTYKLANRRYVFLKTAVDFFSSVQTRVGLKAYRHIKNVLKLTPTSYALYLYRTRSFLRSFGGTLYIPRRNQSSDVAAT